MAVVVAQVFNASDVLRQSAVYEAQPTNPLRLFVETLLPWVDVQGGQGGPLPPGEGEE